MKNQNKNYWFHILFRLLFGILITVTWTSVSAGSFAQSALLGGDGTAGYLGDGDQLSATSQFYNPISVIRSSWGILYIADYANNCVRKTNSSGILSTVAWLCGTAGYTEGTSTGTARFTWPISVALDETNNLLYVAEYSNNRIRKIDLTTNTTSLVAGDGVAGFAEGDGISARFNNPRNLALSDDKQTLYVADMSNHRIREIDLTTNIVSTLVGNGTASTINGIGTGATLYYPKDITLDITNNILYFVQGESDSYSTSHTSVRKVTLSDSQVTTIHRESYYNSAYGITSYGNPYSIQIDPTNNVMYVAYTTNGYTSYWASWISRIDLVTNTSMIIAGYYPSSYTVNYYGYTEGIATASRIGRWGNGMYLDTMNNILYFADQQNNRVRTIDVGTYAIPSVTALQKTYDNSAIISTGATLSASRSMVLSFNISTTEYYQKAFIDAEVKPIGTDFDGSSGYYVSSPVTLASAASVTKNFTVGIPDLLPGTSYHWRYRIRDAVNGNTNSWVNYGGNLETEADFSVPLQGKTFQSNVVSQGIETSLGAVQNITYSSSGSVYVVSSHCIRKFITHADFATGNATLVAGLCWTAGYSEWQGNSARFNNPTGLALDETNNLLYIADYSNNRIRKIDLATNTTSLVAGDGVAAYLEGTGANTSFNTPRNLALSGDKQTLYIADTNNFRIRKIDLATNTTSLVAGNGTNGNTDGIGATSAFTYPVDLSLDTTNNILYVAQNQSYAVGTPHWNYNQSSIRKIDLSNNRVSLAFNMQDPYIIANIWSTYGYGQPYSVAFDSASNSLYITASMYTSGYWNTYSSYIIRVDITTNIATYIAGYFPYPWGSHVYGNAEGISTASRIGLYARGLFLDTTNRILYFSDINNSRIRELNLKNYQNPSVSAMQMKNIENDALTLGATLRSRALRFDFSLRDLDSVDFVEAEIEIKKITDTFDGSGTYITSPLTTNKWADTSGYYNISGDDLELGASYHLRIRSRDQGGVNSPWFYYGGNLDIGVAGATYSDADFIVPASDASLFQTTYITGNGSYVQERIAAQSKYPIKTSNFSMSSPNRLDRDLSGNIYYIETDSVGTVVKRMSTVYPYTITRIGILPGITSLSIDQPNNILYAGNGNNIYKLSLTTPDTGFIRITGGNAVGYGDGYPSEVKFNNITDIAISPDGKTLYLADYNNHRVRKLNLDASAVDYLSVSLLVGSGLGANTAGTYQGASILNPYTLEVSQDGETLFVGNNGNIFRIAIAQNKSTFFRTGYVQVYTITKDRTGDYLYVYDNQLRKISTDEVFKGGDGNPILGGAYVEGIGAGGAGKFASSIQGMVEVSWKLFFIDTSARIRSMIVPNASDASTTPTIPLSAIQKESNNSTTVAIGGVTNSQTMYLWVTMRHPYKFTHIRPEIDIKPIGVDFDTSANPSGTVLGAYRYYVGADVSVNALITKDILNPSVAYHWRARVVDVYGNQWPWAYANSNVETDPDFQTGPTGIGQTNLIMGTLSAAEATGFFPLVQLPAFNYSLVDKDSFGNISKIYFINGGCLAYFDYNSYRQIGNAYTNFIKTVSCDASFASVNGSLKFNGNKTLMYYHSATQVFKYDMYSKAVTLLAGNGPSAYLDGLPTSSYFNGITDVVFLRNLDTTYDEKCMLVAESGNADIRIVPLAGPGFNCKWVVGADNGYVEKWKDISGIACMRQTNDTTRLSINGWVIALADRSFTSVSGLPCMNDSLSSDESTLYYFSSYNIYKTNVQNHPASVTKISGKSANGYLEGDQNNAYFSSVNTIIFDPSFNSLFVNDAGKFREIFLNSATPPAVVSITPSSGKTGDQVTIAGTTFGADPGYANRSSQNYGVLFNGVPATPDDFVSWSDTSIVVKVPVGASNGPVRVVTIWGMSNGVNFTVTNTPTVNYIVPTSAKAGQAVQVNGKYFGTKWTGSYVYFSNGSGSYVAANIIGWADGRIDIIVPAQAATGKMKVTSGYGDSNLTDFTMLTGSPPNKPLPLTPANGALWQSLSPTLITQDYIDPDGDTHQASWWDVRESSQTFANPIYTSGVDTINKTSVTIPPNGMKYNTTYYWRVRFEDSRWDWSDWSDQFQFKTTDGGTTSNNIPPVKPTNTSPVNNTVDLDPSAALVLSASAYMDGETYESVTGATAQNSSSWQVRSFDGTYSTSVFEQLVTNSPLTSVTLPVNTLMANRTYCWHVSYRDEGGASSAYSAETCFKTKDGTVVDGGSGWAGGSGGWYSLQSYDAPTAPSGFSLTNNTTTSLINLVSDSYIDSNTDTLTGTGDKLQTVEWQVLLFSGSTGLGLSIDGNGVVTDSRIASISFGTAKKFRELRENCSDDACVLSKVISYNDLGAVGTYLVRVRHMDQYSMWGDFSDIKTFEVASLPNLSQYLGTLRSIANLSVKTISGDSSPFTYLWAGVTQAGGVGSIIAVNGGMCWSQAVPAMYSIYSYCLYDSNTSTVYGYISSYKSDTLKFEPTKKGIYDFTVTVTNSATLKSLSKIIPVTVQ